MGGNRMKKTKLMSGLAFTLALTFNTAIANAIPVNSEASPQIIQNKLNQIFH